MSNLLFGPRTSSHNPFRARPLTPDHSEGSETSSLPSYHTTLPFSHPSLTRTPTRPPPPSRALPELPPDAITEGPPPPYSLTPDTGGGEILVVQGPRWPFERAPDPFVQQSQPISQSPPSLGSPDPVPEPPTVPLQQHPCYAPLPGRPPLAASVSRQPRRAHLPSAPPPSSHPPAASTSNGVGSTMQPTGGRYPRSTTPGYSWPSNGPALVQPKTYLCHNCKSCPPLLSFSLTSFTWTRIGRNMGNENCHRSQVHTAPAHPPNTGRTVKPKMKGLRKMFSWISRNQQLSTAHTPQPQAGLEDGYQAAVQASLEEAGGDSWERAGYSLAPNPSTGFPPSSLLTVNLTSNSTAFSASRRSTNGKSCRRIGGPKPSVSWADTLRTGSRIARTLH
jgi:hypothetical protein